MVFLILYWYPLFWCFLNSFVGILALSKVLYGLTQHDLPLTCLMRFLKEVALQVSGEESFWYDYENLLSKNLRSMLQNSSSLLLTFSLSFCPVTITCFVLVMIILTNENDNFNYLLRAMNKYGRSQLSQKLNPSFGKCSIGCVWGCLERLEDRWKMSNMWWNKCWSW